MTRLLLSSAAATLALGFPALGSPALAQSMDHAMPGMSMPAQHKHTPKKKATPRKEARPAKPKPAKPTPTPQGGHEGHDMSAMPGMSMPTDQDAHAGHDMQSMPGMDMQAPPPEQAPVGTNLPAGNAPPPPPPRDHAADRAYGPAAMAEARHDFRHEHGGHNFYQVMFNLAEVQVRDGKDGYRWDGEAWFGGDIDRLTIKSEGEGVFREGIETAEVQALWSHAVGPYFNLQAGVRHDFEPSPSRTYATVGFEGLAPYMFEVEGAAFLSTKGDLLGRLEGSYDQRITQRLILQPRAEINFAAQDVPENRLGSGLTDAELGLRLRYEIRRELAPYIGISYEAKTGRTADFARADGEDPTTTSLVAGIRVWF